MILWTGYLKHKRGVTIRRQDLEIKDLNRIESLLGKCQVLHLAINDKTSPYIVPVSYGFSIEGGEIFIYIHGASAGKKYELIKKDENVSVELEFFKDYKVKDTNSKLNACDIGCYYESFIGKGLATELTAKRDKDNALRLIIEHCGFNKYELNEEAIRNTAVFKIKILDYSVKGNLK